MKQFLTVLIILAIIVVGYLLISKSSKNILKAPSVDQTEDQTDIGGKEGVSYPTVNESGTYSIDKRSSSVVARNESGSSDNVSIKSGTIVVNKGNIDGGDIILSASDLKDLSGLDVKTYPEAKLAIKAIVYEQARSTIDNLVFRVDTELTMNGKTNPVSFPATFKRSPSQYYISGVMTPDWKLWGVTLPSNESMSLNITINAVK